MDNLLSAYSTRKWVQSLTLQGRSMESNERFYRRRAAEELSAARRAVTPAARLRRMTLVNSYLEQLRALGYHAACDSLRSLWNEPELVAMAPKSREWILEAN